jgi:transposase
VAELSVHSVIDDEQWEFVRPLLPGPHQPPADRPVNSRAVLAAIVCVVTTGTAWQDLPDVFGVTPAAAQRRFDGWTDADRWRQLAVAGTDTPHARWAARVAYAAIDRAGKRAPGWPDPYPHAIPDEVVYEPEPELLGGQRPHGELGPEATRSDHRPSAQDYTEAHDALNRHHDTS